MSKEKCPNCNEVFECKKSNDCWCMNIPKLPMETIDSQQCLCKDCLEKKHCIYSKTNELEDE